MTNLCVYWQSGIKYFIQGNLRSYPKTQLELKSNLSEILLVHGKLIHDSTPNLFF